MTLAVIIDATQRCHVMHHTEHDDLGLELRLDMDAWYAKFKPGAFAFAFDGAGAREWRRAIWPGYKASRTKDPELERKIEVAKLESISCGLPVFCIDGYEADDLIGALVARWLETSTELDKAVIVSSDRDMVQFLRPGKVTLCTKFSRGVDFVAKFISAADWEKEEGVPLDRWAEYHMLIGDKDMPGLSGVAEVNARKIIKSVPNIRKCLARPECLPAKSVGAWTTFAESIERLERVITARPASADQLCACFTESHMYDPWR